MTIVEAIAFGSDSLIKAALAEPMREANSLLQFSIARDRAFIIAHPEYVLTSGEEELFRGAIVRRSAREPFQHIVGRQEFYGLDFFVSPDVLIPRPETELIVERAIELLIDLPSPRFLEIGVGSGCISVTILKHCAKASSLACDVSGSAIEMAYRNAAMHGVVELLTIIDSDVFDNVPNEKFDLIVSNPPYVPLAEYAYLEPEVRDHDPRIAVTDGSSGLSIIERIAHGSPTFLTSGGHLLIEIGHGQRDAVREMFATDLWRSVAFVPDLQGIPRMLDAQLA
ncbi:MAG: peptide chain release factor N(5)-glutamine methyltransferase [Pyrinomonadaceae bacterium]